MIYLPGGLGGPFPGGPGGFPGPGGGGLPPGGPGGIGLPDAFSAAGLDTAAPGAAKEKKKE